jgi:hypothetical protein
MSLEHRGGGIRGYEAGIRSTAGKEAPVGYLVAHSGNGNAKRRSFDCDAFRVICSFSHFVQDENYIINNYK